METAVEMLELTAYKGSQRTDFTFFERVWLALVFFVLVNNFLPRLNRHFRDR